MLYHPLTHYLLFILFAICKCGHYSEQPTATTPKTNAPTSPCCLVGGSADITIALPRNYKKGKIISCKVIHKEKGIEQEELHTGSLQSKGDPNALDAFTLHTASTVFTFSPSQERYAPEKYRIVVTIEVPSGNKIKKGYALTILPRPVIHITATPTDRVLVLPTGSLTLALTIKNLAKFHHFEKSLSLQNWKIVQISGDKSIVCTDQFCSTMQGKKLDKQSLIDATSEIRLELGKNSPQPGVYRCCGDLVIHPSGGSQAFDFDFTIRGQGELECTYTPPPPIALGATETVWLTITNLPQGTQSSDYTYTLDGEDVACFASFAKQGCFDQQGKAGFTVQPTLAAQEKKDYTCNMQVHVQHRQDKKHAWTKTISIPCQPVMATAQATQPALLFQKRDKGCTTPTPDGHLLQAAHIEVKLQGVAESWMDRLSIKAESNPDIWIENSIFFNNCATIKIKPQKTLFENFKNNNAPQQHTLIFTIVNSQDKLTQPISTTFTVQKAQLEIEIKNNKMYIGKDGKFSLTIPGLTSLNQDLLNSLTGRYKACVDNRAEKTSKPTRIKKNLFYDNNILSIPYVGEDVHAKNTNKLITDLNKDEQFSNREYWIALVREGYIVETKIDIPIYAPFFSPKEVDNDIKIDKSNDISNIDKWELYDFYLSKNDVKNKNSNSRTQKTQKTNGIISQSEINKEAQNILNYKKENLSLRVLYKYENKTYTFSYPIYLEGTKWKIDKRPKT